MGPVVSVPDPTPVLVAHHDELEELNRLVVDLSARLDAVQTRSARLPAALIAILSAGFSQVADEVGLPNVARRRLQAALDEAGSNVDKLIDL